MPFYDFWRTFCSTLEKAKWTQDELAKKVGTSAFIIVRNELNEIKPSIKVAKKLADELGVTIDYLISVSNTIFDKHTLKKIEAIENLTDEDRQQVYYVLDMELSYHKTKQACY